MERTEEDKLGQESRRTTSRGRLETDEHGQNKWEEVKGTDQVCVAEDWQMGTRR